MNNQENKLDLTQKLQIIKELITLLNTATIKENSLTEIFANFLVIINNLFEEIEQRLKHLETKKKTKLKLESGKTRKSLANMKFKYNFLEKKLWKIEEDYLYEIGEENRQIEYYLFGFRTSFKLGNNNWILFNRQPKKMIVHYNNRAVHYEQELTLDLSQIETIFEFTEKDLIKHD